MIEGPGRHRRCGMGSRAAAWLALWLSMSCASRGLGQERRSEDRVAGELPSASRRIPEALRFAHGLLRQRNYALAAEEYERFLATQPRGVDRLDALFGLANARLDQGRYAESLGVFRRFLESAAGDPRSRTARYRVGELSYLTGDLPGARRALETFTADRAPHLAAETAWTYLGDVCFALNDMPAARSSYERSLADFPGGRLADRARYGLARTLAAVGDREAALGLFRELSRRGGPEWRDRAWLQIGTIELDRDRLAEAVEALTNLEKVVPDSPLRSEARLRRARALGRLGRVDEAVELLVELSAEAKGLLVAPAALDLATIELGRGRADLALAAVDSALRRDPKTALRPALLFRSAEAMRKLGRLAEAEDRFREVFETAPDDPWADDALARAAGSALDRKDAATARRLAAAFAGKYLTSPHLGEVRLTEARALAMAGDSLGAVRILETLLRTPAAVRPAVLQEARYELALADRALGRSADAEKLLAGLAEEKSGAVVADARFLLGQSRLEAGRFAEAIPPLERYLADEPKGDVAEFALADLVAAHLGAGQSAEADRALQALAERFPKGKALPRARLRVAEAALAARQFDRAATLFRQVDDPALKSRSMAGLGRALVVSGRSSEAASAFGEVLKSSPDAPDAPGTALAQARALEAADRADEALQAYEEAARRYAGRDEGPLAALAEARLLARLGRHAPAVAVYQKVIEDRRGLDVLGKAGATSDALLAELGWALLDASRPEEADRVFGRILKEFPTSPHVVEARFNLAESANQRGDTGEVVRLLAPVVDSKTAAPGQGRLMPAILYRLGRTQVQRREWKAAASTLDRLLKYDRENPYLREARFLRAETALQLGDPAAAEAGFAALLASPTSPDDPANLRRSARLEQVRCWAALKRWKEIPPAVSAFRSEMKAGDPSMVELDYALGEAQMGQGRMEDARKTFQSVIDAQPAGDLAARAQLMRGEAYFHEGRLREAVREFLQVEILHDAPRWQAAALLEAGKVYERLDQWADAAETYNRLLGRFPEDPEAPAARSRAEVARRKAGRDGSKS